MREFDERVVCPAHGFADADAYYSAADVDLALLPSLPVPVRMVAARDDIVVDPASLPAPAAAARLSLELTERGAHCGDPRGLCHQLVVALRGGRGNYHVAALLRFLEDLGLRPLPRAA